MIRPMRGVTKNVECGRSTEHMIEVAIATNCDLEPVPSQAKAVLVVNKIHKEIGARQTDCGEGFPPY